MNMIKCSQCDRQAIGTMGEGGVALCVEHYKMMQDTLNQQQAMLAASINFWTDQASASVGFPVGARYNIPTSVIHKNNNTFNNLNIDRSNIGVVNTGTIDNLDLAINYLNPLDQELASELKKLTEGIVSNKIIENESRKEVLEQISFITNEMQLVKEKRSYSVIGPVMNSIATTLGVSADLITLWDKIKPLMNNFLS